ncbi:MAG: DUF503 domain-containing protein [Planctomycetota bacterium]
MSARAMFVAVCQIELVVPGSNSLKDKRRVVKSLKDRLHREHQVSVAEVAASDHVRYCVLGITATSGDGAFLHGLLDRIVRKVDAVADARVGVVSREIMPVAIAFERSLRDDGTPAWSDSERAVFSDEEIASAASELTRHGAEGGR